MSRHLSPFHLSSKRFPRWSFYVFIAVATLCFGFYTFAQTLPALSISDASVIEGEGGGTTNAVFNVNLSATSTQTITVNFATRNNSATAPADYTATSGTLTFAPGERSKTITVPVAADCVAEGTESFFVELTNPVNATISDGFAIGTIQTDDNRSLSIADLSFVEGEGGGTTNAIFTVTLNAVNAISAECGPVTVNYATRNNSATAPADYTATTGTLTFNAGETTKTISVPVNADLSNEGNESFFLELSSAANATISDGFAIGTITPSAAIIVVTNVNDSGAGSLRQAIFDANAQPGGNTIHFNATGTGIRTINLLSPLPVITEQLRIDATSQPGFNGVPIVEVNGASAGGDGLNINAANCLVRGLVINRFSGVGIVLDTGGVGSVVEGNYLGTNATGTIAQANGTGIRINNSNNIRIGGTTVAARNLISGNTGNGVELLNGASGNQALGNFIGTNAAGTGALGNGGSGVFVQSFNNTIGGAGAGEGNRIAFNGLQGVSVAASNVAVLTNAIFSNGALGIDLEPGANNSQAAPVLTSATGAGSNTTISGTLNSTPNTAFTIQFFSNDACDPSGAGEGQNFLGSTTATTDGSGSANFTATLMSIVVSGQQITATATDPAGNTSEFSLCRQAVADTLVVTNINDSGAGSLRQAIIDANNTAGAQMIVFNLAGSGVRTIALSSALPQITESVAIDGTTQPDYAGAPIIELNGSSTPGDGLHLTGGNSAVRGLVINNFGGNGIRMAANGSNMIRGNYIGTDATGFETLPNGGSGVLIESSANNMIGGALASERNLISGNRLDGVGISFSGSTGNLVQGNFIGTDVTGTGALGNAEDGVDIDADAANNFVGGASAGAGNVIAFNGVAGVSLVRGNGTGNAVRANSIHDNAGLGIDLGAVGITLNDTGDGDGGPNNLQNFPVLASASSDGANVTVSGNFNSTPNSSFTLEFFSSAGCDSSGNGEGANLLGSATTTTDAEGNASFSETLPVNLFNDLTITATATDAANNTSEFSNCVLVSNPPMPVSSTQDSGPGSLRQAIIEANERPGAEFITFNFPGSGVQTINLTSPLPTITDAVTIDGYSQPGASPNTLAVGNNAVLLIELNGANAGAANGIIITAGNSRVRGLVINRFGDDGILLQTGGDNIIEGNFIGTDAAGAAPLGNDNGVLLDNSANNQIGGTTPETRNIISGNGTSGINFNGSGSAGNLVLGNGIGIDAAGTAAIANGNFGVILRTSASGNTIGGTTATARNVISGNGSFGVFVSDAGTNGNVIQGNYIGTNAAGTAAVGNAGEGIFITTDATNNAIGGTAPGAGNLISGNSAFDGANGVSLGANGNFVQGNFIGTNAAGTAAIGNIGYGVDLRPGAQNNQIGGTAAGASNTIAFNGEGGVRVRGDATSTGNAILSNSIFANTGPGIDLLGDGVTPNDADDADTGPNNLQNFPVLTSATNANGSNTAIQGTLNSTPNTTFRIEFFVNQVCDASGNGEGQSFIGTVDVTTDGSGNANINATVGNFSQTDFITATATDPNGNTSEFSVCQQVTAAPTPVDLSLTNADAPDPATVGSNLAYTLTVSNNSSNAASGVTVTDTLPAGVTFVSATASQGGCTQADGSVNCALGGLNSSAATTSVFDADNEGWTTFGDATTPTATFQSTGGNPGGRVCATDSSQGTFWYFQAPAKFLGNVSSAYNRTLSFDLRQSAIDSPSGSNDVILVGGGLTLAFNTPNDPGTDWTPYSVSLNEAGWRNTAANRPATQAEMLQTLSSLTALRIRGEYRAGADTGCLDNVALNQSSTATVQVIVTPTQAGTLSNTASVTGSDPDTNTANNTATQDTTVNAASVAISGQITAGGSALSGVTVTLSGSQSATTTTDASGNYSFVNLAVGGAYTVTPALSNFSFAPPSQTFENVQASQTANFAATLNSYTISGQVTQDGNALSGVTVTLSGGQNSATTTDAAGNYSFTVPGGATYTVTPARTNSIFTPVSQTFENLSSNQTANFVGRQVSLLGPTPYLSQNDSPFIGSINAGTTFLETFEDGALNTPGVAVSGGTVFGPGGLTDSVDGDDGQIDGSGTNGRSFFFSSGSPGITFTFDAAALGALPTQAGIVWTDGEGTTSFEAFDASGNSLGVVGPIALADGSFSGTTGEDRFFGVSHAGGISAIRISNTSGGIEVDHLQYGQAGIGCIPAPAGLVAWYPGDGNALDIQGGNNGTLQGGATFGTGQVAQAFNLNGSSSYVVAADYPKPTSQVSGEAWVFAESATVWGTIVKNWGSSQTGQFHLGLDGSSGRLSIYISQSNGGQIGPVIDASAFPLNSWQHVAFVADGSMLHLYRNGVEIGTPISYDGTLRTTLPCLSIGVKQNDSCTGPSPSATGFWDGLIDESSIYNRALSQAEIQSIFNAGSAGKCKDAPVTFTISGQIVEGGNGLAGVTVTLSGTQTGTTTTGADGFYSFPNLAPGGDYTVTPSLTNFNFTPPSQTFNNLQGDQTANFAGASSAPTADLSITEVDTPDPVNVNGTLTYTITITNNGPNAATNVVVTDTPPANVTRISSTTSQGSGCAPSGNNIVCNLGNLSSAASATATVVVTPNEAGTITNTVSVAATEPDPNTANNSATATTSVNPVGSVNPAGITISGGPSGASSFFIGNSNSSAITAANFPAGSRLSVIDANINCTGSGNCQSDAYDGSYEVTVGGALFAAPNPSTLNGNTFTAGPVSLSGLNVSQQYYAAQQSATLRTLLSLQNPSNETVTTPVELLIDLGSDSGTTNITSSSGDTVFTIDDRFLITDDSPTSGDPTITSVFYGPGTVALRPSALVQTGPGRNGGSREVLKATFNVTIPANSTRRLLFFGRLDPTAQEAQNNADTFNSNPVIGSDLLSGLSAELSEIVNFNISDAPPSFSISGRITDTAGAGLSVVGVTLAGTQNAATTTDAQGNYSFANLPAGGTYTVTPSLVNFTFAPSSQTFENLQADQTANFTGTLNTFTISGRVTEGGNALAGVTVTLSGTQTGTTTTDAAGNYSFTVPGGANYTVTPSRANYTFTPPSRTFENLQANQTANFSGQPNPASELVNNYVIGQATGAQIIPGTQDIGNHCDDCTTPVTLPFTVNLYDRAFTTATITANGVIQFNGNSARFSNTCLPTEDASFNYTILGYWDDLRTDAADIPGLGPSGIFTSVTGEAPNRIFNVEWRSTFFNNNAQNINFEIRLYEGQSRFDVIYAQIDQFGSSATVGVQRTFADNTFTQYECNTGGLTPGLQLSFTGTDQLFVSGVITNASGAGIPGVTVALTGPTSGTVTTDASGFYSFTNLTAGGNYTVTPSRSGFTFAPPNATFTNLTTNQTANFVGTSAAQFTISGQVLRGDGGTGLGNVLLALSGSQTGEAVTDANGIYSFTVNAGGTYTVTPSLSNFTFTPPSQTFENLQANQTANFTGTRNTFTISGRVTEGGNALAGVTITLGGSQTATTTTDAAGNYSFTVPGGANYTVTPSLVNYTFAPPAASFTNLSANQTASFTATLNSFTVSGRVRDALGDGIGGVTVTLTGSRTGSVTTDAAGNYSFTELPVGGSYTLTPTRNNLVFTPPQFSISNLSGNVVQDFAGILMVVTPPGNNVTVTLDTAAAVTFSNVDGGGVTSAIPISTNGLVPPAGYVLPANERALDISTTAQVSGLITVCISAPQVNDASVFAALRLLHGENGVLVDRTSSSDFNSRTICAEVTSLSPFVVAIAQAQAISGRITNSGGGGPLAGVTVSLVDAETNATLTINTDANGNYSRNVLAGRDYLVTPSLASFTFTPSSRTFRNLSGNQVADFVGAQSLAISGRVIDGNGNGIANISVTLSGPVSRTTQSGADGSYRFESLTNNSPNSSYTVRPDSSLFTFTPVQSDVILFNADAVVNFTATANSVPTPTPPIIGSFEGGQRDPNIFNLGSLTQPPGSTNPAVTVVQQNNQLVITPVPNTTGASFNGYTTVRAIDFEGATANAEIVQTADEGAETVFGVGRDSSNFFRFLTRDPDVALSGNVQSRASGPAGGVRPKESGLRRLIFQAPGATLVQGQPTSILYDNVQHRFWRFRHDATNNTMNFETSPTGAEGTYVVQSIYRLDRGIGSLAAELNAGTNGAVDNPGQAIFDNLNVRARATADQTNRVRFSGATQIVNENAGSISIRVMRSGDTSLQTTVTYTTAFSNRQEPCDTVDRIARPRCDFATTFGRLTFAPGETEKTFTIFITDDVYVEGDETFRIALDAPTGGFVLEEPFAATITIRDNDTEPNAPNPVNSTAFFVRQQYLDFLAREPEPAGFNAWVNVLQRCAFEGQVGPGKSGSDPTCDRITVSSSFFRSTEFQLKGFFVYRFYQASFGREPTYAESVPDLYSVTGSTAAEVEAARDAFTNAWVNRDEFRLRYDGLSNAAYVDRLLQTAAAGISNTTRNQLLADLNNNVRTRAQVLRAVVESQEVFNKEYNRAFVLMQYFGYFQRDADRAGFDAWIGFLNRTGDFRTMIFGFIYSLEYQMRFGTP